MSDSLLDLFLRLVEVPAVSGFEDPMIRVYRDLIAPSVDEVTVTRRGNVIATQNGTDAKAPKIAFVAHLDQIGFVVTNVDAQGFLRFRKVGGAVNRAIQGQYVTVHGEKGPLPGVTGTKPGHVMTPAEVNTIPPVEEMYVDVGARSREDAHALGAVNGCPVTFAAKPARLANNLVASPSLDDRAGVAVLIHTAARFHPKRPEATVHYIATVEEENGLRGAETALFDLDVDAAVAIDTAPAGYQPDVNMRDLYYEVGKGPAIHFGDGAIKPYSQRVVRWLRGVAEEAGIPYQSGLAHGGTDAGALMQTRGGVPAASVGIPRRYSHSPVETMDVGDFEKTAELLFHAAKGLKAGDGKLFDRL